MIVFISLPEFNLPYLKLGNLSSPFATEIQGIWDINIWRDQEDLHPPQICSKCVRKNYHYRSGNRQYAKHPDFSAATWTKHSCTALCTTCSRFFFLRFGMVIEFRIPSIQFHFLSNIVFRPPLLLPLVILKM